MSDGDGAPPRRPIRSGRLDARAGRPERFYRHAEAMPDSGGWVLALDGRPARTPARHALVLPTHALGEAVAAEWNAQVTIVDPVTMPLTKLANTAIDGVAPDLEAVRADIVRFARSDLVCYRADDPETLREAQREAWDPILAWAEVRHGARLSTGVGIAFVPQPVEAVERLRAAMAEEPSPFAIAALHVLTTLTGSVLIALMLADRAATVEEAWAAAHVDEHHQERLWGEDDEAIVRRAARLIEFRSAAMCLDLARPA